MKKLLLATSLFVLPFAAQATGGYIEGQVGYAFIDDVDTETYFFTETGDIEASLDYDSTVSYGLEIGIREFESHNVLRVGLAWSRVKADLDEVSVNASGGTEIGPVSGKVSASELKAAGFDFDNTVDVYTVNAYYDFPVEMAFKPYLGLGVGVADIENAEDVEMAMAAMIGGRYKISDTVNLGLKYQFTGTADFEDKLGIKYDGVRAHMVSATIGMDF